MTMLSPADPSIAVVVTSVVDTEPDVSILVGPEKGRFAFGIRTMERTGTRMDESGFVSGIVDDAPAMARMAVQEFGLAAVDESTPRDMLPDLMQKIADDAADVDWAKWEFTRIEVDGVGFALRVRQMAPGFVAIADLGRFVVTMRGRELPEDRRFTLKRQVSAPGPNWPID
ncbi:hypothetical protein GCM10022381_37300 [Leifsonia kafniensis]|uniref:Uncharacterized protein n=1 Tax=Leifsonia kafniensis TaxID=475957 RepID=A0ABP7KZP3_9MICO